MRRLTGLVAAMGLLCLGVIVGGVFNSAAPAQEKAAKGEAGPAVQKWEYKLVNKHPDEDAMNKLGEEGWELVCFQSNVGPVYQFYKRPKR